MDPQTRQTSKYYGYAQTALLIGYAAVNFLDRGFPLFVSGTSAVIGTALCVLGIVTMLTAFASIHGVIQIAPEPRQDGHLVKTGIYQYLRHPIYTAILITVVGLFLRKPTALTAVASAVVIGFLLVKVRFEEKLLGAAYPDYAEYKTRTWGMIPGLRR